MASHIDLSYRPETYFTLSLRDQLLQELSTSALRRKLAPQIDALLREGRKEEAIALVRSVTKTELQMGFFIHPMFMGGAYLPPREPDEVEIARVTLRSTTYDVAAIYARRDGSQIHYRFVDEYYDHDWLEDLRFQGEHTSTLPLTLGEVADIFYYEYLWRILREIDWRNLQEALDFFWAESSFYPDLDEALHQVASEDLKSLFPEEEEDEEDE
ncbi:hypothetical protein [Rhodothermus bifroesti]|jgi:hypothetical protein|uniref:Uncharacterized protein n=1 Tax=Rhodothermus marinus TaxID=29549 RepID=A0A7V2F6P6_RHOMR|nr:hypothetical protein [Rhodothermus bifroesti]GBD00606.1 hypothetical protein HRbin18_00316 [bacterium HR18]